MIGARMGEVTTLPVRFVICDSSGTGSLYFRNYSGERNHTYSLLGYPHTLTVRKTQKGDVACLGYPSMN